MIEYNNKEYSKVNYQITNKEKNRTCKKPIVIEKKLFQIIMK